MARDLLREDEGRFFRGNLHCHSDRSDGLLNPEQVAASYRNAGYDFIALSDHFEAKYKWQVTDTRALRDERFTTIVGAELSSGPWDERNTYWVTAAGLPVDFEPPMKGDHAEAISRACDEGAYNIMLHPGLNNLPLATADELPALDTVHAVEIYNHSMATGPFADRANGSYMLDGLLELGHRVFVNAGDDAHFNHPADRFGGWVEVHCEFLDPRLLLQALKAGRYYSTQGPALRQLWLDSDHLQVQTSDVYAITVSGGGDRWLSTTWHMGELGGPIAEAEFDLTAFRGSYCRVTAVDANGRCAWSNPIWI